MASHRAGAADAAVDNKARKDLHRAHNRDLSAHSGSLWRPSSRPSSQAKACHTNRMRPTEARAARRSKHCSPFTRSTGIGRANSVDPCRNRAPTFEPIAREILDQVGEDRGAAAVMKELDFRQWTAVHGHLIDVGRPFQFWRVAELAVKIKSWRLLRNPGAA